MHRNFYFAQIKEYNQMITVLSTWIQMPLKMPLGSQIKGEGLVFT